MSTTRTLSHEERAKLDSEYTVHKVGGEKCFGKISFQNGLQENILAILNVNFRVLFVLKLSLWNTSRGLCTYFM